MKVFQWLGWLWDILGAAIIMALSAISKIGSHACIDSMEVAEAGSLGRPLGTYPTFVKTYYCSRGLGSHIFRVLFLIDEEKEYYIGRGPP